ncbi:hypothetical protein EB233_22265 [Mesorhizobium erdmanii]|uniref:Uncharacterized protein n=1 Tax=Mesorhizobium erdmanii TaxID=1777866 RepID=A0A6M7ULA5_9HYPH|nr:hypothetical protein EB233_22265 [Mesorhizobium erdmanii]
MTRHGIIQHSAAGTQPPATDRRTSMVIINADTAAPSRVPGGPYPMEAQRSGLSASISALPGDAPAIADISRRSKSP